MPHDSFDDVQLPTFLYGTAWKEERTEQLTELALEQGFRGIDTANQRRHYYEAAVGKAIATMIGRGLVIRNDLFLQTKFTFQRGQDHRLPYDLKGPIATQVIQSFESSLDHLGVERLDSYLLHGPSQRVGLGPDDWSAWRAMEGLQDSGRIRWLGVSNVTLSQLQMLCQEAKVPPRFVQNRCYATQGWDAQVRRFCRDNGMIYQGFSLLTANQQALCRPEMRTIATRHGKTISQIVFRFALEVGMLPLTGTTDSGHMRSDLDVVSFCLDQAEVETIERLGSN
jgi:diketogulonate reductase-like aldo/keto reductase